MHPFFYLTLGFIVMLSACPKVDLQSTTAVDLQLRSSAFHENTSIPAQFTCDGANVSPPLAWATPPEGTQSLVLIVDDPDAPLHTWTHWIVYNLPPDMQELPTDVTLTAGQEGVNDFAEMAYGGPCPPRGEHRYRFKLYALATQLPVAPTDATQRAVEKAMDGQVLAVGNLTGKYARSR